MLRNIWHFHGLFNKGHHTISKWLSLSHPMLPVLIILLFKSSFTSNGKLTCIPVYQITLASTFKHQYKNENENELLDWHRRETIYPWHSPIFIGREIYEMHCLFPRGRSLRIEDSFFPSYFKIIQFCLALHAGLATILSFEALLYQRQGFPYAPVKNEGPSRWFWT